jgi:cytochrome b
VSLQSRDRVNVRQRIWDLPVRIFHWSSVALVAIAWWTEEYHALVWHEAAGYTLLVMLLFRLAWGFVGSTTARFTHFVRGRTTVWRYMRRELFTQAQTRNPGHNPLGGISVLMLLSCLLLIVVLGLFSVDVDGLDSGRFAYLVSFDLGRTAAKYHRLAFHGLLILIALHLLAILYYGIRKRENLVWAMIAGSRRRVGANAEDLQFVSVTRAGALFAVVTGIVTIIVAVFGR